MMYTVNYYEDGNKKVATVEAINECYAVDAFYCEYMEGADAEIEIISVVEE